MKFIKLASLLFLISCAPKDNPTDKTVRFNIASDASSHVEDFYDEALSRNIDLPRNLELEILEDLGQAPSVVGLCIISSSRTTPTVQIKKSFWDTSSELIRQSVIYHELGHCLLRRPHRDDRIILNPSGFYAPVSIMYPYIIPTSAIPTVNQFYSDNLPLYINELFNETLTSAFEFFGVWSANEWFSQSQDETHIHSFSEDSGCSHSIIPHN